MNKSTRILTVCLFVGAAACTKQAEQNTYDRQETTISNFVAAQLKADPNATVTYNNGSVRITLNDVLYKDQEAADSLRDGGTVSFYYAGYTLSGTSLSPSNLFATNRKESATAAGWTLSDEDQFHIETMVLDDEMLPGLRSGLAGVQNEDECIILFSGKYGFGNKTPGTIPARSALAFHVWVKSLDND